MFGHQDDNQNASQATADQLSTDAAAPTIDGILNHDNHVEPAASQSATDDASTDTPPVTYFNPALPQTDEQTVSLPEPSLTPSSLDSDVPAVPETSSELAEDASTDVDTNDLLDIKQQALTELAPLVDQLDQSPEEKFRTTMMMIQANDNQSLLKRAYQAAEAITDEKVKAQALLDIVNEINYFTHNSSSAK